MRALTMALAAPVFSSRIRVELGSPRVSVGDVGTQTTLMVVPVRRGGVAWAMRAGMKRAVWREVGMVVRWGRNELEAEER